MAPPRWRQPSLDLHCLDPKLAPRAEQATGGTTIDKARKGQAYPGPLTAIPTRVSERCLFDQARQLRACRL